MLYACGVQGRPATATEDKDFQRIFAYLEKGEYLNAKELFEERITGNLTKEEEAFEAFSEYKNAILQDVSESKLPFDDAMSICESGYKAGFEMYFSDFQMQLDAIQNSMTCFAEGMDYFESADFENAYLKLAQVLSQDVNYGKALETVYQIALNTLDSESVDGLLLSEKCLKLIESNLENYMVSELETGGEEKLLQELHDVSLKSAEALQEKRRTLFAAAQFANAAKYSNYLQTLSNDPQVWYDAMENELNQYASLIREWNTLTEDYSTYYILTDNGLETRGESPAFSSTHDDYIQLVITPARGWDSRVAYGVIDERGTARFGISDSAENYIDWVELTGDSWRDTTSWKIPIKIFADRLNDSPNAIILYSDGTMDIYSVDSSTPYNELQTYDNVLDFISFNGEFAILTKGGQVKLTSGIWWMDLSSWEEITEITIGTASPAGYFASYVVSPDTYLYGLGEDGTIHYVEILYESEADQIPESGLITLDDTVVKIAGSAYLTQSGVLGSVEQILNEWLVANYGNYKFSSIAKANPGSGNEYDDIIAATTTDGEVFIIDLYEVRDSLLNLNRQ